MHVVVNNTIFNLSYQVSFSPLTVHAYWYDVQPGIAYSVTYKGTVLKNGGVGVKVKGYSAPPDSNSIFRIGSVSKVFAVSIMK